jgi:hypothetical protein
LASSGPFGSAVTDLNARLKLGKQFAANDNYPGRRPLLEAASKTVALPNAAMIAGSEKAREAVAKGHGDPAGIWDQKVLKENVRLRQRLDDFKSGSVGSSVRDLDLSKKSPEDLHKLLIANGFQHKREPLSAGNEYKRRDGSTTPDPNDPENVHHDIYTHQDGGMVRVKPEGDPDSPFRPEPHASKSVVFAPHETSFPSEAFKVTNQGIAVPKAPGERYGLRFLETSSSDSSENAGYADTLMRLAHTNIEF